MSFEITAESIVEKNIANVTSVDQRENVSRMTYYTIPRDEVLYHSTKTIGQFETYKINFGEEDSMNYASWFTNDMEIAQIQISKCQPVYGPTGELSSAGWIHTFKVIEPINNIKLISLSNKNLKWNPEDVTNTYCGNGDPENLPVRLNGIGVVHSIVDGHKFGKFALCSPASYLEYIGTYTCENTHLTPMRNKDTGEVILSHQTDLSNKVDQIIDKGNMPEAQENQEAQEEKIEEVEENDQNV